MSNEINCSASLSASKGGAAIGVPAAAKSLDMAGDDMLQATQQIGTSWEAISIDDITGSIGMMYLRNLDTTNFIEVALDNAGANKFAKIRPGAPMLFQPPASVTTLYVKADTAACVLLKGIVEA